jgi:hypothetical protein
MAKKGATGKGKSAMRKSSKPAAKRAPVVKKRGKENVAGVRGQRAGDLADDEGALGEPLLKSRVSRKK